MAELCISLLEDVEQELGAAKTIKDIKAIGDRIKKRIEKVIEAIEMLEKNGWKWSTGALDIYLYKHVTKEETEAELKNLSIDKDLIHIDIA